VNSGTALDHKIDPRPSYRWSGADLAGVAGEGFEPSKAKPTDLQDVARSALTRINGVDIRAQGTNRARTAATTTRGDDRAGDGLVPCGQYDRLVGHPSATLTTSGPVVALALK